MTGPRATVEGTNAAVPGPCAYCGEADWTVVPWPLGEQPACLGCVATILHPHATTAALLAWASRFLDLAADRAIAPIQRGAPR